MFLTGNNWQTVVLLMVVCLIPVIYKEAFSIEGVSVSRIASSVLYTLPLCFLVVCIKKKWVFVVVSSILMMVSFFETIMVVLYKNYVIAGNIIATLTTTSDEGTGFVMSSLHALPWTLPVFIAFGLSAQVRKSVDSPPGMLTEDHHHTVHEERQVCYSSHLRPKSLHL